MTSLRSPAYLLKNLLQSRSHTVARTRRRRVAGKQQRQHFVSKLVVDKASGQSREDPVILKQDEGNRADNDSQRPRRQ